jgi:hypothetical protein
MRTLTETITGKVVQDKYGEWDEGLYLGDDRVEALFSHYMGQTIRVTVEVVENEENMKSPPPPPVPPPTRLIKEGSEYPEGRRHYR